MKITDLKYLMAYLVPITGFMAIYNSGILAWSAVIFAFGIIPTVEFFVGRSKYNMTKEEEDHKKESLFFDVLLYLNLPMVFILVWIYLDVITNQTFSLADIWGKTLSVGIVLGACINVAHELGHKSTWHQQWSAKLLLLPSLYMHFIIEHNRGHHLNIATPSDPATSRKGEMVYAFWIRSVVFSYLGAWKLEAKRLKSKGIPNFSFKNEMILFHIIQGAYLGLIWYVFGLFGLLFGIAIAVVGFLLLETINYIEHYGLTRKKLASGRYERVDMRHSWNSNHEIGRIVLYELTRHSDHHFKANRKYQVLRHHDKSPQLPLGYPGSMLMSFLPPLWFGVMNRKLKELA